MSIGPRYRAAYLSEVTLEPSLGLLLLQPSMEGDKTLCKASIDAQPLGHAASTLQPWPSPSAWTKTRSLHGCRNFYLLILPSPLSLSLFLSLFFYFFLRGPTFVALFCVSQRLNFAPKYIFAQKKEKAYFVVTVTPPSLQGLHA